MQKSLIFKKFSQYNYLRFNSNLSNKNVKHHSVSVKLSNSEFKFSTGHLARFANGAVELCQNDNAVCLFYLFFNHFFYDFHLRFLELL